MWCLLTEVFKQKRTGEAEGGRSGGEGGVEMRVVALGLLASGGWRHHWPDVSGGLNAGYSDGGLSVVTDGSNQWQTQ